MTATTSAQAEASTPPGAPPADAMPAIAPPTPGRPSTVVPAVDQPSRAAESRPRVRPGGLRDTDWMALVGALTSSAGLTWLLFERFAPFTGLVGWVFVAWTLFIGVYAVLVSLDENSQAVRDRAAAVIIHSLAFLVLIALVFAMTYVLSRGVDALKHLNFLSQDMSVTLPTDPLDKGGILHGAVATVEQIAICLVITVPLGLTCAVFLNEIPGGYTRFVRTIVEAMTALPSVVAGLFIFSTYILTFGRPKSGFAAAMALSIMMLPIIIRAADVVLRLVPGNLREASYALGSGRWRTVWHVVLPTARSGLATAIILGTARGIGETSPVLLTAGLSPQVNANPLDGPQPSLPLLAFNFYGYPQESMHTRAFGAAAVLLTLVLGLFITARNIGGRAAGDLSARQRRRAAGRSTADARRFIARARGQLSIGDVPAGGGGVGLLMHRMRSGEAPPAAPPSVSPPASAPPSYAQPQIPSTSEEPER